ncbi:MAG: DNA-3-methyladenine glycosylase 2 family protein [Acidimicrobiales bacterium]|nr:DNA-3-methyladenine glycosylase 2 family protein [Acidimicrobiales bacterium]
MNPAAVATTGVDAVKKAERVLAKTDPVMARLIKDNGPCTLGTPTPGSEFVTLCRSIVFQQLAGRAAATIHGRFVAAIGGKVTLAAVLAAPFEDLRGAGLSTAKALSVKDLAEAHGDGRIKPRKLRSLSDDEIVAELVSVRGIGRWTAEMFLMFHLGRLDVWPTGDLAVRNGFAKAWGLPESPKPKEMEPMGDRFRPYRSVVAWYCWTAIDVTPPEGW